GTSATTRPVRVAVTTMRSNSTAAPSGASPGAPSGASSADAESGRSRQARARDSRSGRIRRLAWVERRAGVRNDRGLRALRVGRAAAPRARLLGEDQLVVAGVAEAVHLAAVADQDLALAVEQACAVEFIAGERGLAPGRGRGVGRALEGGRVGAGGKHRADSSVNGSRQC